jgi:anti-anti-sigma factor
VGTESELLQIALHKFGPDVVLGLKGELSATTDPAFERAFQRALVLCNGRIVIDLTGLEVLGSSGIDVLISAAERAKSRDVSVVVQSPRPIDPRLFDILELAIVETPPLPTAPRTISPAWERSAWQRALWEPHGAALFRSGRE